jgi:hypothetical protein
VGTATAIPPGRHDADNHTASGDPPGMEDDEKVSVLARSDSYCAACCGVPYSQPRRYQFVEGQPQCRSRPIRAYGPQGAVGGW